MKNNKHRQANLTKKFYRFLIVFFFFFFTIIKPCDIIIINLKITGYYHKGYLTFDIFFCYEGTQVSDPYFAPDQPNNEEDKCLKLDNGLAFKWNDANCGGDFQSYICEKGMSFGTNIL